MLERTESLLPERRALGAVVVGFEADSIEELGRLLATLGIKVAVSMPVTLRAISPATYIGKGKLEEVGEAVTSLHAGLVAVDADLSPNQLRNLENKLQLPVLDRAGVIIEIFSRRARTREAKVQVELARLEYLLPRLAHFWTHFERQRGGIGLKGMGEKQIEVDRRLLKTRISTLKIRLREIEKERSVQRSGRSGVLQVSLVGYTNAGKSTLLNALTGSRVLTEDKLFATLDSTARALDPPSHPPIVVVDTVGFISKIPPTLVASFRSTLEELRYSDLLIHVVDTSSEQAYEQIEVTKKTLTDLELDSKPCITVLNKADRLSHSGARNRARTLVPGAVLISAIEPSDISKVREKILTHFEKVLQTWEVVVPYSDARLESRIRDSGRVEQVKYLKKGTFIRVKISDPVAEKLGLTRYKT